MRQRASSAKIRRRVLLWIKERPAQPPGEGASRGNSPDVTASECEAIHDAKKQEWIASALSLLAMTATT
jgi:hypothetical protein